MNEISERCSVIKWKPTAEQLQILEELYGNTYSKPSTDQIHHVTNLLKRYGDLQAKNVYYWFQNRRPIDRVNKRRRLDEAQFKPAKIRTGKLKTLDSTIRRCGIVPLGGKKSVWLVGWCRLWDAMRRGSCYVDESERKEKCDMEVEQIVHPEDYYSYEDVQLARPANKIFWRRGWALSRINNMLEPSRTPQCPGLHEYEDRKKPLQTLELFPLKPSDIKCREDPVVDSNCSVI
ncbi:hypothetical protein SUGI_1177720 [Cryptomeria japonica]|nr:hypothetical protein SUGI_1177720 [Cryptomeria japonica]